MPQPALQLISLDCRIAQLGDRPLSTLRRDVFAFEMWSPLRLHFVNEIFVSQLKRTGECFLDVSVGLLSQERYAWKLIIAFGGPSQAHGSFALLTITLREPQAQLLSA